MSPRGFVTIVGAGPGDPDLITIKGLRAITAADVVLHDRLVHPQTLREARSDAVIIVVGKRPGFEDEQEAAIHRLMIDYALEGRTVCRLKGGDPFVFGRGGEAVRGLVGARVPLAIF